MTRLSCTLKQVFFYTTATFMFLSGHAQSDIQAKDMFSEAEKLYSEAFNDLQNIKIFAADKEYNFIADKFSAAARRCSDLKNMNDKWEPAILALYLKCANQTLKLEHFEDAASASSPQLEGAGYIRMTLKEFYIYSKFHASYDDYKELYDLCTTLLANYPADKAGEIKDMQARFKDQMGLADFEHTLAADDAIKFLNLCAQKFPSKVHFQKQNGKRAKDADELIQWNITFTDNRYLNFFAPQTPEKPAAKIDMTEIDPFALFDGSFPGIYDANSTDGGTYTSSCMWNQAHENVIFVDKLFLFEGPWGDNSLGMVKDANTCLDFGTVNDAYYIPFPNIKDRTAYWGEKYPFRVARALLYLYEVAQKNKPVQDMKAGTPVQKQFGF